MPVEWGIEIVLPITLHGLNGPGSVLTTAPREILQRGHSTVLCPVYHIGSTPQQPVVHKETRRALLILVGNILWGGVV